jgi:hypothetical protein
LAASSDFTRCSFALKPSSEVNPSTRCQRYGRNLVRESATPLGAKLTRPYRIGPEGVVAIQLSASRWTPPSSLFEMIQSSTDPSAKPDRKKPSISAQARECGIFSSQQTSTLLGPAPSLNSRTTLFSEATAIVRESAQEPLPPPGPGTRAATLIAPTAMSSTCESQVRSPPQEPNHLD